MRFYKTAGAIGLAAVFSLAMLVFLAASFFPAQALALLRPAGACAAEMARPAAGARGWAAAVSSALCAVSGLALPAVCGGGALPVYRKLSLFVFFSLSAAAGWFAALGFAPALSAGVFARMTVCRELMVVYLSFAMLFLVFWRILGQIDQIRRREAYRFSLELEQDGT